MTASDRHFARRVLIVIALVGTTALVCYAATLLLLAFAGILGAVVASTCAEWFRRHTPFSRRVSYMLVLFGAFALLALAIWLLGPRVADQLGDLSQALPNAIGNAQHFLAQRKWGAAVTDKLSNLNFGALFGKLTSLARAAVNVGIAATVTIVLTAYLGQDPAYYKRGVLALFPAAWRPKAGHVFGEVADTLRRWILGQCVPMLALGIATLIGLLILGIPLAVTLSLFTGVMIFIPFAGAVIAFIAAALVTLSYDPSKLLSVGILFVCIHILEGYVLTPLVQKRAVYLPPALTILAQVLMSALFGFLGLILATPIAAAVLVLVQKLYLEPRAEQNV